MGQRLLLARGGNGGWGNLRFKSSTNQAPRNANPGQPGVERTLWLRLKLIADAGLVGLPNAGKSTFLAATSNARPKIADYPFTTLHPNLGVCGVDDAEFVLADIPGLIEGAHEGAGIGDRFLGHVERCRVLLHLVDGTGEDVAEDYRVIARRARGLRRRPRREAADRRAQQDRRARRAEARREARGGARHPRGRAAGAAAAVRRDRRGRAARCCARCAGGSRAPDGEAERGGRHGRPAMAGRERPRRRASPQRERIVVKIGSALLGVRRDRAAAHRLARRAGRGRRRRARNGRRT